jgi:hypothetical protein
MIRAIFFDFYSVWVPDVFEACLAEAQQQRPDEVPKLQDIVGQYFQGRLSPDDVATGFRLALNRPDIVAAQFELAESDISPVVAEFMRELHGHFVKLGVLANLGTQEYQLLTSFNQHNPLFEVITGPLPMGLNVPLLSQEVFSQALQAIGEPPHSCLVVSGHDDYRQFAESLGIASLPFEGLPSLRQTLEQMVSGPN